MTESDYFSRLVATACAAVMVIAVLWMVLP